MKKLLLGLILFLVPMVSEAGHYFAHRRVNPPMVAPRVNARNGLWYCEARPIQGYPYYYWISASLGYARQQAWGYCVQLHGWCSVACRPY